MKKLELNHSLINRHLEYCIGKSETGYLISRPFGKLLKYKEDKFPRIINLKKNHISIDLTLEARKNMYQFLYKNFSQIIIGKPESILSLEAKLYERIRLSELKNGISITNEEFKNKIAGFLKYIFNYSSFSKIEPTEPWGPYQLISGLNHSVCVYCNSQFIFTVFRNKTDEKKKLKIRPSLDHFFPKKLHPVLGLSIFNLIPSCHTCNSSLKSDVDCTLEKHIHPYIDDLDELGYFEREFYSNIPKDFKSYDDFYSQVVGRSTNYDVKLKAVNKIDEERIKGFEELFEIEERYSFHKSLINDYVRKAIIYNGIYLGQLGESYDFIFKDNESFEEVMLFEDINNSILSKILKDVIKKELKLLPS